MAISKRVAFTFTGCFRKQLTVTQLPGNCKYPLLHLERVTKYENKRFAKSDISVIFYTKSPLKPFGRFFVHNMHYNQQTYCNLETHILQ
jgi:hypothetical protein